MNSRFISVCKQLSIIFKYIAYARVMLYLVLMYYTGIVENSLRPNHSKNAFYVYYKYYALLINRDSAYYSGFGPIDDHSFALMLLDGALISITQSIALLAISLMFYAIFKFFKPKEPIDN